MKPTVYIETTIISYLTAWASRDLVRAAQQQITREWWRTGRDRFSVFASELVLVEASAGDPQAAAERLQVLAELQLADISTEADDLTEQLLLAGALPRNASSDAMHLAIAATNGFDYLLTWNCRHLANAALRGRIEEVCRSAAYQPPVICTPEELFGEEP